MANSSEEQNSLNLFNGDRLKPVTAICILWGGSKLSTDIAHFMMAILSVWSLHFWGRGHTPPPSVAQSSSLIKIPQFFQHQKYKYNNFYNCHYYFDDYLLVGSAFSTSCMTICKKSDLVRQLGGLPFVRLTFLHLTNLQTKKTVWLLAKFLFVFFANPQCAKKWSHTTIFENLVWLQCPFSTSHQNSVVDPAQPSSLPRLFFLLLLILWIFILVICDSA